MKLLFILLKELIGGKFLSRCKDFYRLGFAGSFGHSSQLAKVGDEIFVVSVGVHVEAIPKVAQNDGTAETETFDQGKIVGIDVAEGHDFPPDQFLFGHFIQHARTEILTEAVFARCIEER